jgi:hypothetical protein
VQAQRLAFRLDATSRGATLIRHGAVMPMSLNAHLVAEFPSDARNEDLPGTWLAQHLDRALLKWGWITDEADFCCTRGWIVRCVRGSADLELVIVALRNGGWSLQIVPTRYPASARPRDCHALAQDVDAYLRATGVGSDLRWVWDGGVDEVRAAASTPALSP